MTLNIEKLETMLSRKGFACESFFVESTDSNTRLAYIEIVSIQTAITYLFYIPSRYVFDIGNTKRGVYRIKDINLTSPNSTLDKYGNEDAEDAYATQGLVLDGTLAIEDGLEEQYKRNILLSKLSKEDLSELKSTCRQVERLKYSVKNLPYKVGILFKNFLCVVRRDDSIDLYKIKNYPISAEKRLLVITNLEIFYDKNEAIETEMETIRKAIYEILEKNHSVHARVITKLIESRSDIISVSSHLHVKLARYKNDIDRLELVLTGLVEKEGQLVEQVQGLESHEIDGLQLDIKRAHQKNQLEIKLAQIGSLKDKVLNNIVKIRNKRETLMLTIDKVMFDNTVMMDEIIRNFSLLQNFS